MGNAPFRQANYQQGIYVLLGWDGYGGERFGQKRLGDYLVAGNLSASEGSAHVIGPVVMNWFRDVAAFREGEGSASWCSKVLEVYAVTRQWDASRGDRVPKPCDVTDVGIKVALGMKDDEPVFPMTHYGKLPVASPPPHLPMEALEVVCYALPVKNLDFTPLRQCNGWMSNKPLAPTDMDPFQLLTAFLDDCGGVLADRTEAYKEKKLLDSLHKKRTVRIVKRKTTGERGDGDEGGVAGDGKRPPAAPSTEQGQDATAGMNRPPLARAEEGAAVATRGDGNGSQGAHTLSVSWQCTPRSPVLSTAILVGQLCLNDVLCWRRRFRKNPGR